MLIWGSGGNTVRVAAVESKDCPTCGMERNFALYLQYRYAHLYYLFSWITRREYLVACDVCKRGHSVTREEMAAHLTEDPIPFLQRSGWKIGAGILGGLIGVVALASVVMPKITENAQRPHVGDVYECTFGPQGDSAVSRYGLVRVQSVSDQAIVLVSSTESYADRKAAHDAFSAKRWKEPAYLNTDHPFEMAPTDLERFLRSGKVFNIWRED